MTLHCQTRHATRTRTASALFLRSLCSLLAAASLLSLVGCRQHEFPDYPANYREYAYITNGGSNTVTMLDVVNLRQDRVIPVGVNPTGVAVNTKRNEVYVVNTGSNFCQRHRRGKECRWSRRFRYVSGRISSLSVADGTRAYVANSGSNNVSVIDLKLRRVIATIGVGEGPGVAAILSPDGNTLVVSNRVGGNSVSIVDATIDEIISECAACAWSGCPGATDIAILPDSSKAFIACSSGHQVMAIALATPPPLSFALVSQAIDHAARCNALSDALLAFRSTSWQKLHFRLVPESAADGGEIFAGQLAMTVIHFRNRH